MPTFRDETAKITPGLAMATLNYLLVAAQNKLDKASNCCNFLVHPSVRISDHQEAAGRKITEGTGTMLSSADRETVDKHIDDIVLVMYQLTGSKELKWDGNPLWMPNIKLPNDFIFYKME